MLCGCAGEKNTSWNKIGIQKWVYESISASSLCESCVHVICNIKVGIGVMRGWDFKYGVRNRIGPTDASLRPECDVSLG